MCEKRGHFCCGKKGKLQIAQSLEPFYKALSQKQITSFLKEETICRDKLGFERLTEDSYHQLVHNSTASTISAKFNHDQ